MTLNLGRKIYGTDIPSYGRNSIITGTLTISDFKYAKEVSLTVSDCILFCQFLAIDFI